MSFKQTTKDWGLVSIIIISIWALVPWARSIQNFISSTLGRVTFMLLVFGISLGIAIGLINYLWSKLKIKQIHLYLLLLILMIFYFGAVLSLRDSPEEAVHFLEYGLLSWALYRTFRHYLPDWGIYGASLFSAGLVSWIDELFQWAWPNRIWDLRDVSLNIFSSLLVQLALFLIGRKTSLRKKSRLSFKSLRLMSWLLSINLLILGFTFSLTPARLHQLTTVFPFLSFLEKEESLGGLVYRHSDPEIGIFYSRLTIDQLRRVDALKAQEYAQILKDWRNRSYPEFLKTFPASWHPFLYEMRIHLFRRDQHLNKGLEASSLSEKRKHLFIAYKENQILQKYFRQTLNLSSYAWEEKKEQQIKAIIDPTWPYRSPVGRKLLGTITEKEMWGFILILLLLVTIINLIYQRKHFD